jgi:hypothetical protein
LYRSFFRFKERYAHTSHKAKNLIDENMLRPILAVALLRWWPVIITSSIGRYLRGPGRPTIVVDRYFWDYLVRVRQADAPPSRVSGYNVVSKLVPEPSKAVVLCCKVATLNSRKNELRPEAVDFLYDFYCEQIARNRVKRVLALSTDGPIERSCRQAAWFLLPERAPRSRRSLAARMMRRARNDRAVQWAKDRQRAFGSPDRTHIL